MNLLKMLNTVCYEYVQMNVHILILKNKSRLRFPGPSLLIIMLVVTYSHGNYFSMFYSC